MRHAVYAGSFDPITNGHLWMIEHGSRLFDRLTVAIGTNPDKRYLFDLEERLAMLRTAVVPFANVTVAHYENRFLVHYAREVSATFILRGIRNEQDYGYERGMRYVNGEFDPDITSAFLMPPREYAEISSSFVKGLVGPHGWQPILEKYVPAVVYREFVDRHRWGGRFSFAKVLEQTTPALRVRYAEPDRHYHNQAHIDACMKALQEVSWRFEDAEAAALSIWFHDAAYDPRARDNEEQSAELATDTLATLGVPQATRDAVVRMILATKHDAIPRDEDSRLIADIDLLILAAPAPQFDAYEQAIRAEYAYVSDEVFRAGRAVLLRKLLERSHVFCTDVFTGLEVAARTNLQRSLVRLDIRKM